MLRLTKVFVSPLSRTKDTFKACKTLYAFEEYCEGLLPPHYPVPCTLENADVAHALQDADDYRLLFGTVWNAVARWLLMTLFVD